ncbi:MAG: DUF4019 domain-containing protein [Arenimonas sp.]
MSLKSFTLFCFLGLFPLLATAADYTPSAEDMEAIDQKTEAYFAAVEAGNYKFAYAMQTPEMKMLADYEQWSEFKKKTAADLGGLLSRTKTKVTWYKDPQNAPAPGLYVAVDFVSKYQNADFHSGYVVWYRLNETSEFKLTRHEAAYTLKNKNAEEPRPLQESKSTDIGYKSVEEARAALKSDPENTVQTESGWMIIRQPKANAMWSFTPVGHPSYPSVVKRFPVEKDGEIVLNMSVICEAKKTACDQLVRDFQELNAQMLNALSKGQQNK